MGNTRYAVTSLQQNTITRWPNMTPKVNQDPVEYSCSYWDSFSLILIGWRNLMGVEKPNGIQRGPVLGPASKEE